MMAPLPLSSIAGTLGYDLVFLAIGMGFGAVLEMSGFGDSRKLAAQFYLREMTVLKVMFTAIVVAAVLIFLSSALGLLDFQKVWVNPTYLAPGIVGGLIMGVGFILGGFCPGTSLVAASTLKIDGIFFVLGVFLGVFAFGETVAWFEPFFHSTFYGRFTIPEWLGLPYGVVLVLLILMALAMFWGAEVSEAFFGQGKAWKDIPLVPRNRVLHVLAGGLVGLSVLTAVLGQPTVEDRWRFIASEGERQLEQREVYVDPAELVDLKKDLSLRVQVLEVRSESDFNLFHLAGSRRMDPADARDPDFVKPLLAADDRTIVFVVSNDETLATKAWKDLRAQGVLNLYILEGGINRWLERHPPPSCLASRVEGPAADEAMRWRFAAAVGEGIPSAHPEVPRKDRLPACALEEGATGWTHAAAHGEAHGQPGAYPKKVRLQRKVAAKGGCG
ncbi:YeeE/YedE family protein [Myxococcota bacterium]|nr:YeeE/YedE family protein [Myxococcota bacterium]